MPEGCWQCCTACPCNITLHYASNTIFMYEEWCAEHRMYVGSAKPLQRMLSNFPLEFGHIAIAVLIRYPAVARYCTTHLAISGSYRRSSVIAQMHAHHLPCDQQDFWRILRRGDVDAMGRPASGHWRPFGLLQAVSDGAVDLSCPGIFSESN